MICDRKIFGEEIQFVYTHIAILARLHDATHARMSD